MHAAQGRTLSVPEVCANACAWPRRLAWLAWVSASPCAWMLCACAVFVAFEATGKALGGPLFLCEQRTRRQDPHCRYPTSLPVSVLGIAGILIATPSTCSSGLLPLTHIPQVRMEFVPRDDAPAPATSKTAGAS